MGQVLERRAFQSLAVDWQISYLIFMRRLEDMDMLEQRRANATGNDYVSIFEGHEECRWSEWKHKPAEEMMKHVRDVFFIY